MNKAIKAKYEHLWKKYDFYEYLLTEETKCIEGVKLDELESVLKRKESYAQYLGQVVLDIRSFEQVNVESLDRGLVDRLSSKTDEKIKALLAHQDRNRDELLRKQQLLDQNRAELLQRSKGIGVYNNQKGY